MYKMLEFQCRECHAIKEQLVDPQDPLDCFAVCDCGGPMDRCLSSPRVFSTIIAMYPGSKKHKAGYQHKFGNQPATKTQIGYGGSVSTDNPKK